MNTTVRSTPRDSVFGAPIADCGQYQEVYAADGSLRPHWAHFADSALTGDGEAFASRWQRAQEILRNNGVTYNVYGDSRGQDRPWALDPLPLIIGAGEWSHIEVGGRQRARLLNAVLHDVYGPQRLLHEGILPPEIIFGNPGFMRPCCGINYRNDRMLTFCALDLGRRPDGGWTVLDHRCQAPSGAGYALENRMVMSTVFEETFSHCNVERLASYFRHARDKLASAAPLNPSNPRVVLLTPGPFNESYFEHYYLAKYLGLTLVEGADLTVRNERVFVKTLEGLLPVDVIVRRQDDQFCDSLELRADSVLAIPGILQAVRAGNVVMANALGSAFAESPALIPFLPVLCQYLLGERLLLPSVETWWLGQKDVREQVLANMEEYEIGPAFVYTNEKSVVMATATEEERQELASRIRLRPEYFVARGIPPLSTMPVWENGVSTPRLASLRTFFMADDSDYLCMPGGLARATAALDSTRISMQEGAGSKDTWIVHDTPCPYESMLPVKGAMPAICRSGITMPSRTADNLYWLGRYIERAESMARILRCIQGRSANAETRAGEDMNVLARVLRERILPPKSRLAKAPLPRLLTACAYGDFPGSVLGCMKRARTLGSLLRDSLSDDAWNMALGFGTPPPSGPVDRVLPQYLATTIRHISAFSGITFENMTRGPGWRFLDLGRRLERCHQTAGLLHECQPELHQEPPDLMEALLKIMDGTITYRSRYLSALRLEPLCDLLLMDDRNPRSLVFQLAEVKQHVELLDPSRKSGMPPEQRLAAEAYSHILLADLARLCHPEESEAFANRLVTLEKLLEQLHNVLAQRFFSHSHSVQLSRFP